MTPNGAYHLYPTPHAQPLLVEVYGKYLYAVHLDTPLPLHKVHGKLVPLAEVREELEAQWPEMPDLEGIDRFAEHEVTGEQ